MSNPHSALTVRTLQGFWRRVGAACAGVMLCAGWLGVSPSRAHASTDDPAPAAAPEQPLAGAPQGDTAQTPPGAEAGATVPAGADEAPQESREVVVYLKDGQRLTGILESATSDEIRVRIAGILTPLSSDLIEKYDILPPITQRYLDLRAAVGNDPQQILQLARWLRERERYELALTEVQRVLAIDANFPSAKGLKIELEQQILLKQRARSGAPEHAHAEPAPARPVRRPVEFPVLTEDQINLIKVYETDLSDRPRLVIQRDTITRLLEQNAGHPLVPITREGREAWYRKDPTEILDLMFRLQARNLYGQVKVVDAPRSFNIFRDDVQRNWLLNKCATNACHGGEEAGRFMLTNKRPNSEQSVYTNFLILSKFRLAGGESLINAEEPIKSPLLQLGLPREDSRYPHPAVTNSPIANGRDIWRPAFKSLDDRSIQEAVEWIRMLYRPRPDYPISYELPTPRKHDDGAPATPPTRANPAPVQTPAPADRPAATPVEPAPVHR